MGEFTKIYCFSLVGVMVFSAIPAMIAIKNMGDSEDAFLFLNPHTHP